MAESKKIQNVDSVTVSSSVLSDIFGLTERRVRQLAEEGIIVKIKRGRYDLSSSVRNYIIHLKTNNDLKEDKTDKEIDYDMEHALLERARREKVELELAAMRGQMHHSEDVERVMNDMLANFRSKLLALPTKASPMLIARDDIGTIQEILHNQMLEVLQELSDYNPEEFYNDQYIDIEDDNLEGDVVAEKTEDKNKNN
ncbi:hypothetical protein CF081_19635 [Clostridium botulinum]|uniref:hypothetical protein n=1 Tax=Clostridium botulinum TaxID=1491 RepID=UPI0007749BA7|nr:hypothetical protein [Clostridium botulinum]AUN08972.1 hypothetical protein RSJ14_20125 [Clostridium botulinum]MBN3352630.1 hypothetical protein [Clostridium botulinum]MBN3368364.1 hypothetical protein [Clostridium botulinum]MBN3375880.1 hypothetical protein [Clostridium botulinum]MBO0555684.1 hypothetical protein [Clostridium botulinum]